MSGQHETIPEPVAIGVEIGISKATIALIDGEGTIHQRRSAKILWNRPPAATLEPCLRTIDLLLQEARERQLRISGLGCSVAGTLDAAARRPLFISNLPALNGFPLAELLEARYNLPVSLHVDVEAALRGEHSFGIARGLQRVLYLSSNAVVGAAMLDAGKIVEASQETLGHVCHLSVAGSGARCSCGKRGCINTLMTLDALQKILQRALRKGETTSLFGRLASGGAPGLPLLIEEATAGDPLSAQIIGEWSRWLSLACSRYRELYTPEMIILGGLFAESQDFIARVGEAMRANNVADPTIQVVAATSGQDAALLGSVAEFLVHPSPLEPVSAMPTGFSHSFSS